MLSNAESAAMSAPTAMAGAYANRLFSDGCSTSAITALPPCSNAPVLAIVNPRRPRPNATVTAMTPPAIAV